MPALRGISLVPLRDIVVQKGPGRVRDVGKDIMELADSIRKVGLLEPIVVCPSEKPGKYEIITGQRRFLAHQELKEATILAAILDERVDETTAKVLSISENLVRRDVNPNDYIDACTALYRKYGSIKAVVEETGLPYEKVRAYVKYDRLKPEMRSLVDKGELRLKVALRAQDAASVEDDFNPEEAVKLAKEMSQMSGAQQSKLVKQKKEEPSAPLDELIKPCHRLRGGQRSDQSEHVFEYATGH